MENIAIELLNEAINLELNVSDLYMLYHEIFLDDKEFWWKIANEEMNHAALLKSGKLYLEMGLLPKEILYKNTDELRIVNKTIEDTILRYRNKAPSRKEAYEFAVKLEDSAYELHYQKIMSDESNINIIKIFQNLNRDDKDHAERIKKLI